MAVTRRQLDEATCSAPGCDHTAHDDGLWLHAACHPDQPVQAFYLDGVIEMQCAICGRMVVRVEVAD